MPTGTVISAGKMSKTIRVQIPKLVYNRHIRKNFLRHERLLAHDENSVCVPGDVVMLESGHRCSRHVKHLVTAIVAPMHTGQVRGSVESVEEWCKRREVKRGEKEGRREKARVKEEEEEKEREMERERERERKKGEAVKKKRKVKKVVVEGEEGSGEAVEGEGEEEEGAKAGGAGVEKKLDKRIERPQKKIEKMSEADQGKPAAEGGEQNKWKWLERLKFW